MKLNHAGLKDLNSWKEAGIMLPSYDVEKVTEKTQSAPQWVHFGIGNIFRVFIGGIVDGLLEQGIMDRGLTCVETFDYEVADKIYKPFDNLVLSVILKNDGTRENKVLGSLAEAIKADFTDAPSVKRLREIFAADSLQMVSFTVTEKGYALKDAGGKWYASVWNDMEEGPEKCVTLIGIVTAMLLVRFQNGKKPIALVSMDNCAHNGELLRQSVLTMAQAWLERKKVAEEVVDYLKNEEIVAFPWTMIDKITPRPSQTIADELEKLGLEEMHPVITGKRTYIAPFANAEKAQYLVIEDHFPNGRPHLEKGFGVYMTDRETVIKAERMKVTACLNPVHSALGPIGVVLGIDLFADLLDQAELRKLARNVAYGEGLPMVEDPGIISPEDFTDEVTWKSTNTDVVTVDDNGLVNAQNTGSATIKVVVGEQSTTCTVKVVQPVERIYLNESSISLDALDQYQLEASVYPKDAYNKDLEWKSEDETIATVSETGLVKAVKKGKTKIVVKAKDGSGKTTSCDVTVNNNAHIAKSVDEMESAHGYENNSSDFWVYTAEGLKYLNVTFDARTEVEDGFDYIYIYRADGKEVGKYTGKELSGVTIRVPGNKVKIKLVSGKAGNAWGFKVTGITEAAVKKPQVISVADHIDKTFYDEEFKLNATVTTGDGALFYESENEDIVTVNEKGSVYIRGTGTVRVIVIAAETEEYEETRKAVEISVAKAKQDIEVEYDSDTIEQEEVQQIYVYNNQGTVTFESENPQIATVDDEGNVIGITPGDVGIIVKAEGGKFYEDYIERIVFHIVEKGSEKIQLSTCEIYLSDAVYVYDGTEKTPSVTVIYDDIELTEDIDYVLLYTDNVEPGTATVTIEAAENSSYIGMIQQNFEIRPVLDENAVVVKPNAFEGCVNLVNVNIKATVTEVGDHAFADCKNLRNIYFYGNCPKIGTEIFKNVKGTVYYPYNNTTWTLDKLQNYGGTITWCPWDPQTGKPAKRDMSLCKVTVNAKNLIYDGKAKTPKITVTDSGKAMQSGKDYTVSYKNNTRAGTGIITVTGTGNYGGSISTRFTIGKDSNIIKVSDINKTVSAKAQTVSSGVRVSGGAKLTYSSSSKSVKVSKTGKITIAGNFVGRAVITVKSSETSCYKAASKKFNVTVKPAVPSITKAVNSTKSTIAVSWKGSKTCSGYAVQYSANKSFKSGVKTIYITKNSTMKATLTKLAKGKTYYIRAASYKKSGNTKILSSWSKVKSVKIRK